MTKNTPNAPVGAMLSRPRAAVIQDAAITAAHHEAKYILSCLKLAHNGKARQSSRAEAHRSAIRMLDFFVVSEAGITVADLFEGVVDVYMYPGLAPFVPEAIALVTGVVTGVMTAALGFGGDLPRVMSAGAAGVAA